MNLIDLDKAIKEINESLANIYWNDNREKYAAGAEFVLDILREQPIVNSTESRSW